MRRRILIYLFILTVSIIRAQSIEGIISDINGNSLNSVNISIINQSNGVTSDINGLYIIDIKKGEEITLRYTFYKV